MIQWMKNEQHGYMPVYNMNEVAEAEKIGWKKCEEPGGQMVDAQPQKATDPNPHGELTDKQKFVAKFGKPPHPNMKPDSVRAALEDN